MEGTLSAAIADYIEQRKQAKLEPLQKALNKVLDNSSDTNERTNAQAEYHANADPIETAYAPEVWLTDAAKRAKQISLATHSAKFTHSDAKASSALVTDFEIDDPSYLVTKQVPNKKIDAVGNAAALDVARLLKINVNGETLINQLQDGHVNALNVFTGDPQLLDEWKSGFSLALGDEKLAAHTLVKQTYFPLNTGDNEYHLLCPLYSSAMAGLLYDMVRESRFGDSKEVREARRKGYYDERQDVQYPSTAVQVFGGSKPQNISQLNSERHGQGFLLNCAPLKFKAQITPPIKSRSLFNRRFSYKNKDLIQGFRAFLSSLTEHDRNFKTRYKLDYEFVQPLIDALMSEIALVQSIPNCAGWSSDPDCKMKLAYKLLLDPYNPDEQFQSEREKGDWLEVVANDFSHWLLQQLKNEKAYMLGDEEHRYFKKLCLHQLRGFERGTVLAQEESV